MTDLETLRRQSQDMLKPMNKPSEFPEVHKAALKKGCIFCDIVDKKMPTYMVAENGDFMAFLDIQPKAVGHTVIVPKIHAKGTEELTATESSTFIDFVNKISGMLKDKLGATGYTLLSANGSSSGQFVEHFATHIIPTYSADAAELQALNMLQTQRVPPSIMDEVLKKLK
jgi:histidine triad (HIT) family protein